MEEEEAEETTIKICENILKSIKPIAFDGNDVRYSPYVRKFTAPKLWLNPDCFLNEESMKNACLYEIAENNASTSDEINEYRKQDMAWYARAVLNGQLGAYVPLGQLFEDEEDDKKSKVIWKAAAELGCYEAKIYLGLVKDCC
jgi:hypothetical protein